jgi:hypothetical protein
MLREFALVESLLDDDAWLVDAQSARSRISSAGDGRLLRASACLRAGNADVAFCPTHFSNSSKRAWRSPNASVAACAVQLR